MNDASYQHLRRQRDAVHQTRAELDDWIQRVDAALAEFESDRWGIYGERSES